MGMLAVAGIPLKVPCYKATEMKLRFQRDSLCKGSWSQHDNQSMMHSMHTVHLHTGLNVPHMHLGQGHGSRQCILSGERQHCMRRREARLCARAHAIRGAPWHAEQRAGCASDQVTPSQLLSCEAEAKFKIREWLAHGLTLLLHAPDRLANGRPHTASRVDDRGCSASQ